jgi:hypothetical protein
MQDKALASASLLDRSRDASICAVNGFCGVKFRPNGRIAELHGRWARHDHVDGIRATRIICDFDLKGMGFPITA